VEDEMAKVELAPEEKKRKHSEYMKAYWKTPKGQAYSRRRNKRRASERKAGLLSIKLSSACDTCGVSDPDALVVTKNGVFCCNCRAMQVQRDTYPETTVAGQRRKQLAEYKSQNGCVHCGRTDCRVLDFHHRDPSTKKFDISTAVRMGENRLSAELAKCEVVCKNCHAIIHAKYRRDPKLDPCCTQNLKN
jgi:hypothetical protein